MEEAVQQPPSKTYVRNFFGADNRIGITTFVIQQLERMPNQTLYLQLFTRHRDMWSELLNIVRNHYRQDMEILTPDDDA